MRLKIAGAIASLLLFAVAVGCNGFFVDPTLTGLTVGPTTSIQTGQTVQMTAVGTYNDGSTNTVKNVYWSSSSTSIASVSSSGLVTGVSAGQATITGSSGTVSGTGTITVTIANLTSIKVQTQPTVGVTSVTQGDSQQFQALGTSNGQQVDITDSVTWSLNPTPTGCSMSSTGLLTTTSGSVTSATQFQIIAQDPSTGITGTLNFTLNP
jgi:trimeric autotransporter adhesin